MRRQSDSAPGRHGQNTIDWSFEPSTHALQLLDLVFDLLESLLRSALHATNIFIARE
jgi:hypothetical protein